MSPARRARVWLWCTHLASVESDRLVYAWPPIPPEELGPRLQPHDDAAEAFKRKADSLQPDLTDEERNEFWRRCMDDFDAVDIEPL